jgi:hypothetical protein
VRKLITAPVINADAKSFKDRMRIAIEMNNIDEPKYKYIVYSINEGTKNRTEWKTYEHPFEITRSSSVQAVVKDTRNADWQSNTVNAQFVKKPNDYSISLKLSYDPQYHAGGPDGLLDGIRGSKNWRKGDWQGYQGKDFEAIIDMKRLKDISQIKSDFLQDSRAWILMPTKVDYSVSEDGEHFTEVKSIENEIDPKKDDAVIKEFTADFPELKARYVKVKAHNFGTLPEWHQGAGGQAYIFVDEIEIK